MAGRWRRWEGCNNERIVFEELIACILCPRDPIVAEWNVREDGRERKNGGDAVQRELKINLTCVSVCDT